MNNFRESGFSMVEALIGLGLFSAVVVAGLQLQKTASQTQIRMKTSQELNTLSNQMQKILSIRPHCTLSLRDKAIGESVDGLKLSVIPSSDQNYLDPDLYAPAPGPELFFRPGEKIPDLNVEIVDLRLEVKNDSNGVPLGDVLRVSYKYLQGNQTDKISTHDFFLLTEKEGGIIKSCLSATQSLIEQSIAQACKSMEGEFTPGTKKCQLKNLPHCFLSPAGTCGEVFTEQGSFTVEKLQRERRLCTTYYQKRSLPARCRHYEGYITKYFCTGASCSAPPPMYCREIRNTSCDDAPEVEAVDLVKCCRTDIGIVGGL